MMMTTTRLADADVAAATALINHFVHGGNDATDNKFGASDALDGSDGRTVFHNLVVAAAMPPSSTTSFTATAGSVGKPHRPQLYEEIIDERSERKFDGLFLIEALCVRMKEMDCRLRSISSSSSSNNSSSNNKHHGNIKSEANIVTFPSQSHFHRLLLARDFESGYTPLHHAIYHRDLLTVLMILGHAADSSSQFSATPASINGAGDGGIHSRSHGGLGSTNFHGLMKTVLLNQSHHHPLQLLNGNLRSLTENNGNPNGSGSSSNNNSSARATTGAIGGSYRNSNQDDDHHYHNNHMAIVTVNKLAASTDHENLTPLQLLGKTSELGLERCRLALYHQHRMHTSRRHHRRSSGGSGGGGQHEHRRRHRMRSFGDDRDYDALNFEIENVEDENDANNNNDDDNDIMDEAHGFEGHIRRRRGRGNSFHDVVDLDNDEDHRDAAGDGEDVESDNDGEGNVDAHTQHAQSRKTTENHDEYGCEVLTFGRADHYALGVPQFTTSSSGRGSGPDGNSGGSTMLMGEASCKPRRVESFALSALRRNWSNSLDSSVQNTSSWDGNVDSPAVAVAASTHHTLVCTQSGRLFAFGYGKSGRLGTGDENHRPLPTPIFGQLTNRIVVSIAAAENHSLCSTSDGKVFAWGSNSFGQLGSRKDSDPTSITSRLSPRRVEGLLKQSFVVAVAAGDRHSVALTKSGEVYCWGDNKSGQLGMYNGGGCGGGGAMSSPTASANNGFTSPTSNIRCSHGPQRVEGLWSTQPRRRAIAIAAAEFSTLVLTLPPTVRGGGGETSSLASLPVNCVYGWGHGNHSVMRVVFSNEMMAGNASVHPRSSYINPTAIACARYHNVAITVDGRVFTWGLHSETLGVENRAVGKGMTEWSVAPEGRRPRSNSLTNPSSLSPTTSSSAASSPQLVLGMLPENGGGKVVAVSASESHTAVVTSDGHLFTWGTSVSNNLLGHKGVKWQPSPRKVQRVHRAVGVAAAKEHTVLLMATTFPPLPGRCPDIPYSLHGNQPLTLQECAAIEISRNVDLFNVVPTAIVARRLGSLSLVNYCDEIIRKNLDGVLAVGNKNDFASFLSCGRSSIVGRIRTRCERDGTFHPFLYDLANSITWADNSLALLRAYAVAPQRSKVKRKSRREKRSYHLSGNSKENGSPPVSGDKTLDSVKAVAEKVKVVALKIKTASLPPPAIENENDQSLRVQRKLFTEKVEAKAKASDIMKFHCEVCNIVCPDSDSFTLHINGRKHRNRLTHASAEEEKQVAQSLMETKRKMMMMKVSGEGVIDNALSRDRELDDCEMPFDIKKTKSAWANSDKALERRERTKSFQEILNEQQQKSSILAMNSKEITLSPTTANRSFGTVWIGASETLHHSLPPNSVANGIKSNSPIPLSAFIKKGAERKPVDAVGSAGATRGTGPSSAREHTSSGKGWGVLPASKIPFGPQAAKSFSEIQQEEEALRSNEDHMCHIRGNHWYVQQRERAASIGEIQEQEEKDREMQFIIEEQRRIENDILSNSKQKKQLAKIKRKKHERHSRPTNSIR